MSDTRSKRQSTPHTAKAIHGSNAIAFWYGPHNTAESIDPIGFNLASAILAASSRTEKP